MQSDATTVEKYLEMLPTERQQPMREMLAFIRKHIPADYGEDERLFREHTPRPAKTRYGQKLSEIQKNR